ncbi:hypothetical protein [Allokutzneria oryzae]|uniref:PE domain-containing protein n=1 Tax=Allokutzneria oryzae TaxID=1378989 RepID=A0ABV5ZS11_9PSEU
MSGYDQALQSLSAAREALPGPFIQAVLDAVRRVADHLAEAGVERYGGLLEQVSDEANAAMNACAEIGNGLDEDIARTQQLMSGG